MRAFLRISLLLYLYSQCGEETKGKENRFDVKKFIQSFLFASLARFALPVFRLLTLTPLTLPVLISYMCVYKRRVKENGRFIRSLLAYLRFEQIIVYFFNKTE